jgi:NAD(P)-dependent dehydrogenase (short-subunit alcohol dehydrogenase family)
MEFPGRVALITGASRGIGRATALALAHAGAAISITARTLEPTDRLSGSRMQFVLPVANAYLLRATSTISSKFPNLLTTSLRGRDGVTS